MKDISTIRRAVKLLYNSPVYNRYAIDKVLEDISDCFRGSDIKCVEFHKLYNRLMSLTPSHASFMYSKVFGSDDGYPILKTLLGQSDNIKVYDPMNNIAILEFNETSSYVFLNPSVKDMVSYDEVEKYKNRYYHPVCMTNPADYTNGSGITVPMGSIIVCEVEKDGHDVHAYGGNRLYFVMSKEDMGNYFIPFKSTI